MVLGTVSVCVCVSVSVSVSVSLEPYTAVSGRIQAVYGDHMGDHSMVADELSDPMERV